jgi:TFIIIC subunit triple barrel domain
MASPGNEEEASPGNEEDDDDLLRLDFPDFANSDLLKNAKKISFKDLESDAPTCDVDGYKFVGRHEPALGTQLMFELPKEPGGRASYKGMCNHLVVFRLISIPSSVCTGQPLKGEWTAGVSGKISKPKRRSGKRAREEAQAGEDAEEEAEVEGRSGGEGKTSSTKRKKSTEQTEEKQNDEPVIAISEGNKRSIEAEADTEADASVVEIPAALDVPEAQASAFIEG